MQGHQKKNVRLCQRIQIYARFGHDSICLRLSNRDYFKHFILNILQGKRGWREVGIKLSDAMLFSMVVLPRNIPKINWYQCTKIISFNQIVF